MWSAGVMLYVLLTSSYPFDPNRHEEQLEAAIKACECVHSRAIFLMTRNRFSRIKDAQFYPSLRLTQFRSYDRRCLDSVSEAARALIFGLLELDPSRRLTASQALEHPFITQLKDAKAKVTPRRNSVLEKLQRTVTVIRGYQVRACR
jgi:serine/threonine protein kinase